MRKCHYITTKLIAIMRRECGSHYIVKFPSHLIMKDAAIPVRTQRAQFTLMSADRTTRTIIVSTKT